VASSTAHDTLARKSKDAGVISGGHPVAMALKNEGVDTVFTFCGGPRALRNTAETAQPKVFWE
jgi:acetolactate synthase-1/2/3 large subunit